MGGYVLWNSLGRVCTREDTDGKCFGPDVCDEAETPVGIFGLSHDQLQSSEWVTDDALTALLKVDVRPNIYYRDVIRSSKKSIDLPPSNLLDQLPRVLDSGLCSDVTFKVRGEA